MGLCACGREIEGDAQQCEECRALAELELTAEADASQIEAAFRRIVEEWQPRRQGPEPKLRKIAEMKLDAVKAAHAWLTSEAHNAQVPSASDGEEPGLNPEVPSPSGLSEIQKHPMLRRGAVLVAFALALAMGAIAVNFVLLSSSATAPAYTTFKTNLSNAIGARLEDWKKPSTTRLNSGSYACGYGG